VRTTGRPSPPKVSGDVGALHDGEDGAAQPPPFPAVHVRHHAEPP
jgi:hypothetical protein